MPAPSASPDEETIVPTFETQKLARTYILDIPSPRGQITDRTGLPLAQNKISYNLGISFPTPLDFTDAKAVAFAREKIDNDRKNIWRISGELVLLQEVMHFFGEFPPNPLGRRDFIDARFPQPID